MTDTYKLHEKAFANVAAYVIMRGDDNLGSIAFKFPRDGAGRLYAYLHIYGAPMVRGFAGGFGYDKQTAAVADAARKLLKSPECEPLVRGNPAWYVPTLIHTLAQDGGHHWDNALRAADFQVYRAV